MPITRLNARKLNRSNLHEIECCAEPSWSLLASGNSSLAADGTGGVLDSILAGGLERCPDRFDEANDPGRRPRLRQQTRLRSEGPLHHLAYRAMGQPSTRRCGGLLFAP